MEHEVRAAELFQAVLALEPDRRASFLHAACNGDARLRQSIERLLAADAACDGFLVPPRPDGLPGASAMRTQSGVRPQSGQSARPQSAPRNGSIGDSSGVGHLDPHSLPRDAINGYEIVKLIRGGGQAVVYQAVHKATRRKVAIKVMKHGPFAGGMERARFERETQILGQLSHPNIVAIHDTGIAAGCSYFVMDYVSGTSLDEHAEVCKRSSASTAGRGSSAAARSGSAAHIVPSAAAAPSVGAIGATHSAAPRWAVRPILQLFVRICEAVNAAHLRGIIHRDLKPGNIRVDDAGEPHILDFGLAKVIGGSSDGGVVTLTGEFLGSLHWAAPEQAEQKPDKIDVRTDVYSLGMILYYMLTGQFPYDVTGGMRQVLDRIMSAEPARPRGILPYIDPDVETILLKCLQKERERRYQSAGDLARDVQQYLAGDPIDARRDSLTYMLGKMMRKHRVSATVALAFLLLLVTGLATSLTLWRQASAAAADAQRAGLLLSEQLKVTAHARDEAAVARDDAALEANRVSGAQQFLESIFAMGGAAGNRNPRVKQLLDNAAERMLDELALLPDVAAVVDNSLGLAYQQLGKFDDAERHLERAAAFAKEKLGPQHPDSLVYLNSLAGLRVDQGRDAEAEAMYSDIVERGEAIADIATPRKLSALHNLASSLQGRGKMEAAESIYRRVLGSRAALLSPDHPDTLLTMNNLAACLAQQRKWADAHSLLAETLVLQSRVIDESDVRHLDSMHSLAGLLVLEGDLANAHKLYPRVVRLSEASLGRTHPRTLNTLRDQAVLATLMGEFDFAVTTLREVRATLAEVLADTNPEHFAVANLLAEALIASGNAAEGLKVAEQNLKRITALRTAGPASPSAAGAHYQIASARLALDQADRAMPDCEVALHIRRETDSDLAPPTIRTVNLRGRILMATGDLSEAVTALTAAVDASTTVFPAQHWMSALFQSDLGDALTRTKSFAQAESNLAQAYNILDRQFGRGHPRTLLAIERLVSLYRAWDKPDRQLAYSALLAQSSQPATTPSDK